MFTSSWPYACRPTDGNPRWRHCWHEEDAVMVKNPDHGPHKLVYEERRSFACCRCGTEETKPQLYDTK